MPVSLFDCLPLTTNGFLSGKLLTMSKFTWCLGVFYPQLHLIDRSSWFIIEKKKRFQSHQSPVFLTSATDIAHSQFFKPQGHVMTQQREVNLAKVWAWFMCFRFSDRQTHTECQGHCDLFTITNFTSILIFSVLRLIELSFLFSAVTFLLFLNC